jgi:hypothetical protein
MGKMADLLDWTRGRFGIQALVHLLMRYLGRAFCDGIRPRDQYSLSLAGQTS